ncbi:MAG: hypothetical protein ACFB13_05445 [Kiloniellaceae bacterium]
MPQGLELIVDINTKADADRIVEDYRSKHWATELKKQGSGKYAVAAAKSPPLPQSN